MSSFCTAKATHIFFSKKFQHICVSLDVYFNESFTNNVVSFEQLGPGHLELEIAQVHCIPYNIKYNIETVTITSGSQGVKSLSQKMRERTFNPFSTVNIMFIDKI